MKIVWFNVAFALCIKILVLILATVGAANMVMGIFADVGVSIICILNSMRTLRFTKK
jgi:Cd2+/Zn2+-exporting ATPase